jgi:uncharacterized protein (DUF983 family)
MLVRAMTRHCPWCGHGRMFASWLKPVRRCPRCGLVIERGEGAMLGSMSINIGVTSLLLIAVLVVWFAVDLPDVRVAALMATLVVIAVVVPLLFFPFAKLIWTTIDLWMHGNDPAYVDPDEARRLANS